MHFNLFLGNLQNAVHAEDYLFLIKSLVEAAGHSAIYDDRFFAPSHCNIILDGFPAVMESLILDVKRKGAEVILVATEFVTGDSFNQFGSTEKDNIYDSCPDHWKERFNNFVNSARHARAVWLTTSHPAVVEGYRRILGDVPLVFLPPCFFPDKYCPNDSVRDIDFFFSGSSTEHRTAILNSLAEMTSVRSLGASTPDFVRRHLSRRAKASLNLRINKQWRYPSQLRTWYHLMNGGLVVQEACQEPMELEYCTLKLQSEHLVDECLRLVQGDEWKKLEQDAHERFVANWHVDRFAKEFIERTFQ